MGYVCGTQPKVKYFGTHEYHIYKLRIYVDCRHAEPHIPCRHADTEPEVTVDDGRGEEEDDDEIHDGDILDSDDDIDHESVTYVFLLVVPNIIYQSLHMKEYNPCRVHPWD